MEYAAHLVPPPPPTPPRPGDMESENTSLEYIMPGQFVPPQGGANNTTNDWMRHDWACVMTIDPAHLVTSHKVYLFTSLTFVLIGLVGNSLSILVFSSREMRIFSSNVYLLALAVSDSAYLVTVFLTKIINTFRCFYFPDVPADVTNRNTVLCKGLQYLQDLFSNYSTCLILAFTVERFFAVYKPLAFKETFSVRRARITSAALFVLIAGAIAPHHMLYIGRLVAKGYQLNLCIVLRGSENQFTIAYVAEVLVFRITPVLITAVLNVFIIVNVRRLARRQRRRQMSVTSRNGANRRDDKNMQMTVMLIVVSTTYIILFIPVLIHFVIWKLDRSNVISTSDYTLDMWQNYTKPLYIAGFAINFFLYTMSGRVFREQLMAMLRRDPSLQSAGSVRFSPEQGIALVEKSVNGSVMITDL